MFPKRVAMKCMPLVEKSRLGKGKRVDMTLHREGAMKKIKASYLC
jgi:hypothetical protein